jgi:hypothetical protein
MWGTTSRSDKLTGDSGSVFEALLIGDGRLFRSLAENLPLRLLGLLQQYRHETDVPSASGDVCSCGDSVAKLQNWLAAIFPRKEQLSDNRRSMCPQARYRSCR